MAKKDGREVRGEVRRDAWAWAARKLAGGGAVPRWVPLELTGLWLDTLRDIEKWVNDRSAGKMGPPPGGVGQRKRKETRA